jgi:hypothetical protein
VRNPDEELWRRQRDLEDLAVDTFLLGLLLLLVLAGVGLFHILRCK